MKKSKSDFIKEFKKSHDFVDAGVVVSEEDHKAAEQTAHKPLIEYIKSAEGDLTKLPIEKGILTLNKKEDGLYNGFFQDHHGQVVEKFYNKTPAMIAKTLQVKDIYKVPEEHKPSPPPVASISDAAKIAEGYMDHHNETMHSGPQNGGIKIKYGDFELEIKKSINTFVKSYKKTKNKDTIKKAITSWRRNLNKSLKNDHDAAKELLENWDQHSEGFYQIVYAMHQGDNDK